MTKLKAVTFLCLLLLLPAALFSQESDSLKTGDMAPKFYLKTLEGESFFLTDWCGELRQPWKQNQKHVVLLSFFATWCQPCREEIPELENISRNYKERALKVFLVNFKENTEAVAPFKNKMNLEMPILLDKYGVAAKKYGVNNLPKLFLIDQAGKIKLIHEGYSADLQQTLNAEIARLFENN
jgi:cytochrome c biogenesis protein CcmG/thiol:disulfide interchange protein DsbE